MKTSRRGLLALAGGALPLSVAGRAGATGAAVPATKAASFVTRWTAAYTGNHIVNALSTRGESYRSVGTIRESSPLCDESFSYTGFAIALDDDGRQRWTVTATEVGYDYSFRDVAPTGDGGALVVGSRKEVDEDNTPFHTGLVLSVGPDGTERWREYYGAFDDEKFLGVAPLADGEFLVLGRSGDEGDVSGRTSAASTSGGPCSRSGSSTGNRQRGTAWSRTDRWASSPPAMGRPS